MGARTKGWGQIIVATTNTSYLQASTDTTISNPASAPTTASDRSDTLVFLVAGTPVSVRWGGNDGVSLAWGAGLAANTATWRCDVFYEGTQTLISTSSGNPFDAPAGIAGAAGSNVDRTFTFTPSVTCTARLRTNIVVTVTVGGAAVANDNTDNGNFGSAAPSRLAGSTLTSFTPGLISVGSTANSIAQSGGNGSGVYATYGKTIVNTLTMGVGSQGTDASETMNVAWQQSVTTFANTTIAATASATKPDPGLLVANTASTGWPNKTAFSPNLVLSIANSALSTALGGTGIPWTFFSGALPAGWSQTAGNAVGATTISKSSVFTADNSLVHQKYMQLNTTTVNTPPDGVTDLTHNVPSKTGSDVGEITHRVKDANGVGINGIAYTSGSIKIQDVGGLTTGDVRAGNDLQTRTLNGAAGWVTATSGLGGANANFLGWPDVNPAGVWNYSWSISTANAIGLDNPSSPVTFTLQAQNPNIHIVGYFYGQTSVAGNSRHLLPGDSILLRSDAVNENTGLRITPDSGTAWITHTRFVDALAYSRTGTTVTVTQSNHNLTSGDQPKILGATDSGLNGTVSVMGTTAGTWTFTTASAGAAIGTLTMSVMEQLVSDTDNTFAAFKPWGPSQVRVQYNLSPDALDATLMFKVFSNTAGWGAYPILGRATLVISGVNYQEFFFREMNGTANPHSGYSLDPILLALGGKIGTR